MEKIFDYLKDEDLFITFPALLAGSLGVFMLIVTSNSFLKVIVPGVYPRLIIYALLEGVFLLAWLYKRKAFPKTPRDRIGLVVSITTENNKDKLD